MRKRLLVATVLLAGLSSARAQQPSAAILTDPSLFNFEKLAVQGRELVAKAQAGSGSAGVRLATWQSFYASLNGRSKTGGGEQHREWNDILIVLDGECTEMTGGTMVDPKEGTNGEVGGARLEGATPHRLRKGDFIEIPAGTNHQQVIDPGKTVVVLAIKIPVVPQVPAVK